MEGVVVAVPLALLFILASIVALVRAVHAGRRVTDLETQLRALERQVGAVVRARTTEQAARPEPEAGEARRPPVEVPSPVAVANANVLSASPGPSTPAAPPSPPVRPGAGGPDAPPMQTRQRQRWVRCVQPPP